MAVLLLACKNTPEIKPEQAQLQTPAAAPTVYEGSIAETLWEDKNVPIKVSLDKAVGTFTLDVDYDNTKSFEGEKVADLHDAGPFTLIKDAKWGDVYALEGKTTGTSLYQVSGNQLKELDHEKSDYTGQVLTMKQ